MGQPLTAYQPARHTFISWWMNRKGKARREAARAEGDGELISASCNGTTLTEIYLQPGGVLHTVTTADSPSCGGSGTGGDGLLAENDNQLITEGGDRLVIE